jgi:hypothetical protein
MEMNPYEPPRDQPSQSYHSRAAVSRTLSAPELFGVVVRSLGLIILVYSIQTGLSGFAPAEGYSSREYFMQGGVGLGLGLILMFSADAIMRVVYGRTHAEGPQEDHGRRE